MHWPAPRSGLPAARRALLKLASLLFSFAAAGASAQATVLYYDVVPGTNSSIAASTGRFDSPPATFSYTNKTSSRLTFDVNTSDGDVAELVMAPPAGQNFAVGPQEIVAVGAHVDAAFANLIVSSVGLLNITSGRIVVLDATFENNLGSLDIVSFAADFEQATPSGDKVYGEVRINSTVPLTVDKPADAFTPDAFAFTPYGSAVAGQVIVSNTVTVYGTRAAAPVSIVGGEYSLNDGPFTSEPGFASNRDHIAVRVAAPASAGATASATLTVGGVSAPFNVTTYAPGTPFTAVTIHSDTPSNVGANGNFEARSPDWVITAPFVNGHQVDLELQGPDSQGYFVTFTAPFADTLAAGPYEATVWSPFGGPTPGLTTSSPLCSDQTGRFVIHDVAFGPGGTLDRLAASFVQFCRTGSPIYGEIRINSDMPLPSMVATPRTTPYPFTLGAQSPVHAGSVVLSNWTAMNGIDQAVPISIAGGQYSVDGGPLTSAPGTVSPDQLVVVQLTASRWPGEVASATLTVGGRSATLSATTYQPGMALSGIYYESVIGGALQTHLYLAPPGKMSMARNAAQGIDMSVLGLDDQGASAQFVGPNQAALAPGDYEGATAASTSVAVASPGLIFSGDSGVCGNLSGHFTVRDVAYANDGTPTTFAADLGRACDFTVPPVYAEVRFNSTEPFTALMGDGCTTSDPGCVTELGIAQSTLAAGAIGKDMVFDLTVTNNGPGVTPNVVVTDTLPVGSTFVWASAGCANASGVVTCRLDSIARNATAKLRVVARPTILGATTNDVMVSADQRDLTMSNNGSSAAITVNASPAATPVLRYRLYSTGTQEHLYTTDLNEYNVLGASGGWNQEGTVGHVLDNPGSFNAVAATPYYRLYNSVSHWHHWTTDANEYYTLIQFPGWNGEGVDGYILPTATAGATQLYRLNYPFLPGLHHWTIDANEYNTLITPAYGWIGEGGSGFVIQ